jgi:hypothetical protein
MRKREKRRDEEGGRRENSGGPFFEKKAPPDPLQKTFNVFGETDVRQTGLALRTRPSCC